MVEKTRFRRPPLVYLNGGASPFILRRNDRFHIESESEDPLDDQSFEKILAQLPFPVIGVPWHQLEYWPEMLVVGHEVGHAVERDLKLENALDKGIDAALGKSPRARYWHAWRSELFADAYGCAAGGPAFVSTLADFIAQGKKEIEAETVSSESDYPPAVVRILFNRFVLENLSLPSEIAGWDYRAGAKLEPFGSDAEAIAKQFCGAVKKLLKFTTVQWNAAGQRADAALKLHRPETEFKDLRVLIASIRRLFELAPGGWDRMVKPEFPKRTPLSDIDADIAPLIKRGKRDIKDDRPRNVKATADAIYSVLSQENS